MKIEIRISRGITLINFKYETTVKSKIGFGEF